VRLWRELLAGSLAIQADLYVAVYTPEKGAGLWDLARDHYGSQTPMSSFRSTGEVLRAIADGRATLGVLPVPGLGDVEPWWRFLAAGDAPVLRVIARLPFGALGNARSDDAGAFVVGAIAPEESGTDRSLYVIETGDDVSRTRLLNALGNVGRAATVLAASAAEAGAATLLVEFDGWIPVEDARLKDALAGLGDRVLRCTWLGGYAQPLSAAELAG
jgi:hypothetical protein